jgi:hypothetical protein
VLSPVHLSSIPRLSTSLHVNSLRTCKDKGHTKALPRLSIPSPPFLSTLHTQKRLKQEEKHSLNIVPLLPPAPAARVLLGRAFEARSARSAAALRRMAVAGPPGGFGEEGRAVVVPAGLLLTGEVGRGEDCLGWTC